MRIPQLLAVRALISAMAVAGLLGSFALPLAPAALGAT